MKASFFKGSSKIWCNYRNDNLENLEGQERMRYCLGQP